MLLLILQTENKSHMTDENDFFQFSIPIYIADKYLLAKIKDETSSIFQCTKSNFDYY